MHQLDDTFKQAKAKRSQRKRKRLVQRLVAGGIFAVVVGAGAFAALNPELWRGMLGGYDYDAEPVEISGGDLVAPDVYIPAIVDLAGDPMKISLGDDLGLGEITKYLDRPETIPADRAQGDIALLSDVMITTSQRFMTTLPSSPKDFAFYQSQRVTVRPASFSPQPAVPEAGPQFEIAPPAGESALPEGDASGGWGGDPTGEAADPVEVERPEIEDTTSVAVVRPTAVRFQPEGEYIGRILVDRTLESLMQEIRYAPGDAAIFALALAKEFGREGLLAGDVIAIRGVRETARSPLLRPVQVSLYADGAYVGTLARSDSGVVVKGADPWVYDNLFDFRGDEDVAQPGQQYRLLDAIYSTAVRNRVPTGVLGEAIMLLSRSADLNAFAAAEDRLIMAYAREGMGDAGGSGRVLYIAVKGPDRNIECYVFKLPNDGDYSCFSENSRGQSISVPGGMTVPVRGALTSTFGPRMHPIFKEVRVHTGVDWAAPMGTPIVAAFSGTVAAAGDGGGYGNLLRISHPDGRETYYAHLQAFAEGLAVGTKVNAGDLVGYVGTTGNSTGPHLHFEVRVAGNPVDPMATATASIAGDGGAVDALTDRIVQVESGGNATAKNPLSSATGLGQFIKSTWLRMMNTYRPDLAASMTEAQLLELRNDPTISREMVANLAREGESYLRARGHAITAGRLYLCHFLGMEGAALVLSSEPALQLADVLGQGVISANPFLTGKDVAYVIQWAEGKMSGRRAPSAPPPQQSSPEFRIYQAAINELLAPPPPLETLTPEPQQNTAALAAPDAQRT